MSVVESSLWHDIRVPFFWLVIMSIIYFIGVFLRGHGFI
jgi:hypothetical protein